MALLGNSAGSRSLEAKQVLDRKHFIIHRNPIIINNNNFSFSKKINVNLFTRRITITATLRRRKLLSIVESVPERLSTYFNNPFRKVLFYGIALFGGFYAAQTISLSFGALGVNDVVASALCVLSTEYVTRSFYTAQRRNFGFYLLNVFKMGFIYGLFVDAFKLAS